MKLEMYIAGILIDKREINYEENISLSDKEKINQSEAHQMCIRHYKKIRRSGVQPKFYLRFESKMNREFEMN